MTQFSFWEKSSVVLLLHAFLSISVSPSLPSFIYLFQPSFHSIVALSLSPSLYFIPPSGLPACLSISVLFFSRFASIFPHCPSLNLFLYHASFSCLPLPSLPFFLLSLLPFSLPHSFSNSLYVYLNIITMTELHVESLRRSALRSSGY